jgi:antitoxin ParD1/3/4
LVIAGKISLTAELERRIAEQIESGLYSSASEVVREGLRLLFETDAIQDRQLAQLRADIQVGLDQADRGQLLDGMASRERVKAALAAQVNPQT